MKRFTKHPDVELRISACAHLLAVDELFALDELRKIEKSPTRHCIRHSDIYDQGMARREADRVLQ
jgi:hypothetical protein